MDAVGSFREGWVTIFDIMIDDIKNDQANPNVISETEVIQMINPRKSLREVEDCQGNSLKG